MFSDYLKSNFDWDTTTRDILAMTSADVEQALSRERLTDRDFMALISPAAAPYIETMAQRSRQITERRFGKTISIFIPLYITNSCTNSCVYCGFNRHNKIPRVILTPEQIEAECKAIKEMGPFENLLIVTGENPLMAGTQYIEKSPASLPALLLQPHNRSNAPVNRRLCQADTLRPQWCNMLSGNI